MTAPSRLLSMAVAGALCALASAQSTNTTTCSVRVAHEAGGSPGSVLLFHGPEAVSSAVPLHTLSTYTQTGCEDGTAWTLRSAGGQTVATFSLPDAAVAGTTFFTVLVTGATPPLVATSVLSDLPSALPDDPATVSAAAVRVVNALASTSTTSGVHVYGVTLDCYHCALQFLCSVPFGEASAASASWSGGGWYLPNTEYGVYVEVLPASAVHAPPPPILPSTYMTGETSRGGFAGTLALSEHGAYTLVVHDGSALSWTLTTDQAGQDQWLPLLYAALTLLGMGVGFHAVSWGVANAAYGTSWGNSIADEVAAVRAGAGKRSRECTLVRFLGLDNRIASIILSSRAQQARAAGQLHETLLGEEETGGEGGAGGGRLGRASSSPLPAPLSSGRFRSLDTLRGLSLTVMAFVNYGAGSYSTLDHSAWNGLHLADLVFPWFVWMSGVSMAISFDSARKRGASRADLSWKITVRSAKLFALGLFMNGGAVLSQWRVLGVLQYFAVSNFIVGNLEAWLHPDNAPAGGKAGGGDGEKPLWLTLWRDVGRYAAQWGAMAAMLALYLLLQAYTPLPSGCPGGYTGPGGLANNGAYFGLDCTGGAHRVLDLAFFGVNHVYHGVAADGTAVSSATCAGPYLCDVHDPEGALGWLTAGWMVWMGLQAGRVLVHYKCVGQVEGGVDTRKLLRPYLTRLVAWGSAACLLGGALCGFSKEGGWLPINKNLWSPSFIAILSGLGFLWIALFWTVIDHARVWSGSPYTYVGMNSIAFYILHETYSAYFPLSTFTQYPGWGHGDAGPVWYSHTEALGSNIAGVLCWVAVARFLYVKGVFVNL